jgi:hypothetical protein
MYLITITYYWLKKLYRGGLDKYYMIKFEISERYTRTRLDKFLMNYYDICRYFNGMAISQHDDVKYEDRLRYDEEVS